LVEFLQGDIATHVPNVRERIQDTLLNVLSLILAREPYAQSGVPSPFGPREETSDQPTTPTSSSAASSAASADHSPILDDVSSSPLSSSPARPGIDIPIPTVLAVPSAESSPLIGSAGKAYSDSFLQVPPGSAPMSNSVGSIASSPNTSTAPLTSITEFHATSARESPEVNIKVLALNTLASFGFDIESTKNLVHRVVVNYLEHDNMYAHSSFHSELSIWSLRSLFPLAGLSFFLDFLPTNICSFRTIRRRAVIACGKLLGRQQDLQHLKGGAAAMAIYVIQRLLKVSATDLGTFPSLSTRQLLNSHFADSAIRRIVLETFDKRFDTYLAQPDFLRCLFLFLYDEVYEVR